MLRIPCALALLLRRHWPAFVLAVLVGLIHVLPSLVANVRYGIAFNSPVNIRQDDEALYFARIREVIDGYPLIGNPYLWEHKAKPPAPVFLGEFLSALPIAGWQRVTGQAHPPIVAWGVIYDFFWPALLTLLAYTCLFLLTRGEWLAVAGSAFFLLGVSPTDFARLVSPQFNFLFVLSQFLILFLLTKQHDERRRRRILILAGALNFGLLAYLYTYYWTFFAILLVLFAVVLLVRGERALAASVAGITAGGLLVAIPYFALVARAMALPEFGETLRRIGLIETHFPSGVAIVVPALSLLAAGAMALRRKIISADPVVLLLASGLAAAIVAVNQHVITGKNLEFSSHYLMLAVFWITLAAAFLVSRILAGRRVAGQHAGGRAHPRVFRSAIQAGVIAVVVSAVLANIWAFPRVLWLPPRAEKLGLERYRPVLAWLAANTRPDEVIYTPDDLSGLVPIYTGANVYFENLARLSFLSDDEVLDRFVIAHYYQPMDDESIRQRLRAVYGVHDIDLAAHHAQQNKVRRLLGLAPKSVEPVRPAAVARIRERLAETRGRDFEAELKRYRVDYIVWDTQALPEAPFGRLAWLEPVGRVDTFRIYRVH